MRAAREIECVIREDNLEPPLEIARGLDVAAPRAAGAGRAGVGAGPTFRERLSAVLLQRIPAPPPPRRVEPPANAMDIALRIGNGEEFSCAGCEVVSSLRDDGWWWCAIRIGEVRRGDEVPSLSAGAQGRRIELGFAGGRQGPRRSSVVWAGERALRLPETNSWWTRARRATHL